MKGILKYSAILVIALSVSLLLSASFKVQRLDNRNSDLKTKVENALDINNSSSDFYVIYNITKDMTLGNRICTHNSRNRKGVYLDELLLNKKVKVTEKSKSNISRTVITKNRYKVNIDSSKDSLRIAKRVWIVLKYNDDKKLEKIRFSTSDCKISLEDLPIVYVGSAQDIESLNFIESEFWATKSNKLRRDALCAISLHNDEDETVPRIIKIFEKSDDSKTKEEAVFWLGTIDSDKSVEFINEQVYETDNPGKVRKHAVFALSINENHTAGKMMMKIAKSDLESKLRKEAVFWLGQKLYEDDDTLEDIAYNSDELEIQEAAVFALYNQKGKKKLGKLARIARNHPSKKIRKEAMFWLGQINDEDAMDKLLEIIEENL